MKKIKVSYREKIVTKKIVRVPNSFKFRERNEEYFKNDEFDEDIIKFNQIWEYFNKQRDPFKLKSNQYLSDFYLISVEELD